MKKRLSGWLVAALLAAFVSSAVAQSATAYSSSAVGVIRKTLPAGQYAFISMPLADEDGILFSETPLVDLPSGSRVLYWDADSDLPGWVTMKRDSRNGWGAAALNHTFLPGEPLFVFNNGSTDKEVVFSGTVPATDSQAIAIPGNSYRTVANPYPVPFVWGESDLAKTAASGSRVFIWGGDAGWISAKKDSRNGWLSFATNTIQPAEGLFFYETGSDHYWTIEKPYSWPVSND